MRDYRPRSAPAETPEQRHTDGLTAGMESDVGCEIVAGGADDMEGASDVLTSDNVPAGVGADDAKLPFTFGSPFPSNGAGGALDCLGCSRFRS